MVTPRIALWLLVVLGLQIFLAGHAQDDEPGLLNWTWVAAMWAGWSAILWMIARVRPIVLRGLLLVLAAMWHCEWMHLCRDQPLVRYAVMMGGYAVIQSMSFRWAKTPQWRYDPMRLVLIPVTHRRQFSIFELMGLMTAIAVLIVVARQYSPPTDVAFWIGLPVVYVTMVLNALGSIHTYLARQPMMRPILRTMQIVCILAGAALIGGVDPIPNFENMFPYLTILSEFAVALSLLTAMSPIDDGNESDDRDDVDSKPRQSDTFDKASGETLEASNRHEAHQHLERRNEPQSPAKMKLFDLL